IRHVVNDHGRTRRRSNLLAFVIGQRLGLALDEARNTATHEMHLALGRAVLDHLTLLEGLDRRAFDPVILDELDRHGSLLCFTRLCGKPSLLGPCEETGPVSAAPSVDQLTTSSTVEASASVAAP